MLDVDVASHVASPHRAALPWPLPNITVAFLVDF